MKKENILLKNYCTIDITKFKITIHKILEEQGYCVKKLQEILHLSCPQTIYHWLEGKTLPSIDNLYNMSKLFQVSINELLDGK
jgi:transcriptional regulator with XRE-family HTH domain